MSLHLALTIDTGGAEPARVWDGWNCTWNVTPMWRAALPSGQTLGVFLEGKTAAEALPDLRIAVAAMAVAAMEDSPAKYRAMEPENGWGSYQGALQARGQQTRPPRRRRRHQITRPCRPHQAPEHLQIPGHALAGAVLLLLADLAVHVTRSLS
jgi:hypothetical protein